MRPDEIDALTDARELAEEGQEAKRVLPLVHPSLAADIEETAELIEQGCDEGWPMEKMLHLCHRLAADRRTGKMLMRKIETGADAEVDLANMVQAKARQEAAPAHVQ